MKVIVSRNLFIVLLVDTLLLCSAFYLAHLFRFDFAVPQWAFDKFRVFLPIVVILKLATLYLFDSYRGMWRYTGLNDLINVIKASTLASICLVVFILFVNRFDLVSRSVFIIDWCLTVISVVTVRIIIRLCFEAFAETISFEMLSQTFLRILNKDINGTGKRVLIIGAGDCGQKICREFKENPHVRSQVVGFLDDDQFKIGRKIHGISVLNTISQLESVVEFKSVDLAIIAITTASAQRMRRL